MTSTTMLSMFMALMFMAPALATRDPMDLIVEAFRVPFDEDHTVREITANVTDAILEKFPGMTADGRINKFDSHAAKCLGIFTTHVIVDHASHELADAVSSHIRFVYDTACGSDTYAALSEALSTHAHRKLLGNWGMYWLLTGSNLVTGASAVVGGTVAAVTTGIGANGIQIADLGYSLVSDGVEAVKKGINPGGGRRLHEEVMDEDVVKKISAIFA